jgi:hypothetical protein
MIKHCAYCGKEIKVKKCRAKLRNYCNASHQLKYEYEHNIRKKKPHRNLYVAHKIKCSGKNHYNWKGGIKKRKLNFYDSYYQTKWQELRTQIYERDNYTCQICGIHCNGKNRKNGKSRIQCHHIIPYRISQDNSLENLITLCASCHMEEERKYYSKIKGALSRE